MRFIINPDEDDAAKVAAVIEFWTGYNKKQNDKNQSTLTNNNTEKPAKKYFCNNPQCKKEIPKEVVAFCLFKDEYGRSRFNGKVYCKDCQKKEGE